MKNIDAIKLIEDELRNQMTINEKKLAESENLSNRFEREMNEWKEKYEQLIKQMEKIREDYEDAKNQAENVRFFAKK